MSAPSTSPNATTIIQGWVSSSTDRGSIDIVYSCCVTILLCCWVSTCPNVPSLNDKWYHHFIDKFNLACIGLLGPDFLFALALGQLANARKSVKLFRQEHPLGDRLPERTEDQPPSWTLRHAFYADMGGFLLRSPDYPQGFPVNAEQLHYLIKHNHVEYPWLTTKEIKARNKADGLSKFITFWQVLWFSITELQRARAGFPMTTLELTALSFSLVMVATSLVWYLKPTIGSPTIITTVNEKRVDDIRVAARETTHPGLPNVWYRTPLDFISRRRFSGASHWAYATQLSYKLHIPVFGRPMQGRLWDRVPCDLYYPADELLVGPSFVLVIGFSASFLAGWNFFFPSPTERLLWRICSVYHAIFSTSLAIYYTYICFKAMRLAETKTPVMRVSEELEDVPLRKSYDIETQLSKPFDHLLSSGLGQRISSAIQSAQKLKNNSPDQDPDLDVPLAMIPALSFCALYSFCRFYFYLEDFIGLRAQPGSVYLGVNRFLPFM